MTTTHKTDKPAARDLKGDRDTAILAGQHVLASALDQQISAAAAADTPLIVTAEPAHVAPAHFHPGKGK